MLTQEISAIIQKTLEKWKDEIVGNYEKSGEKTTGKTGEEFEVKMYENGGRLLGASYVYVLESGRGETKKGGDGSVRNRIKKWIKDKGVFNYSNEKELESLSWAISKMIHKEGTQLFREGGRDDIYSNVLTENAIDDLLNRIAIALTIKFSSEIVEKIKNL